MQAPVWTHNAVRQGGLLTREGMVMNFNALLARARGILLAPRDTWPAIVAEPASAASIYTGWVLWLAAIPPLASFIGMAAFGISVPFVGTLRLGLGSLLRQLLLSYALALVMVFVMALIVEALAPSFGGSKDRLQALKAVAYAYTPVWIVGVFGLIPQLMGLSVLLRLAAAGYAIYLLYLGLPATMKCPQDKAAGYAAVSVVIGIVLAIVLGMIVGSTLGFGRMGGVSGLAYGGRNATDLTVNPDSALGRLAAAGKQMEAAGKQMQAAQSSGDANAPAVTALSPDQLKAFLPPTLGALKRVSLSVERGGVPGMQFSQADAQYSDAGGHTVSVEISDLANARGMLALAGMVQGERETDHGYDKTYTADGQLVHERWDTQSNSGEYAVYVGDRFMVKASGTAANIDALKAAVSSIDLKGLAALKDANGAKPG